MAKFLEGHDRNATREAGVASTMLVAEVRRERIIPSYPRLGKKLTRGARFFSGRARSPGIDTRAGPAAAPCGLTRSIHSME
jgi:hypothetical protein